MAITERELFRGYGNRPTKPVTLPPAYDHAVRVVLEERIAELWSYRRWFRSHVGWIPEQQVEARTELRLLVRLARRARRTAEAATVWHIGNGPRETESELRFAAGDR